MNIIIILWWVTIALEKSFQLINSNAYLNSHEKVPLKTLFFKVTMSQLDWFWSTYSRDSFIRFLSLGFSLTNLLVPLEVLRDNFGCFNVHFRFVLVHFETKLFVLVVSKYIRNTETNRNKIFIGFKNEPKQTRNRSCSDYFRFESKFFLFVSWTPYSNVTRRSYLMEKPTLKNLVTLSL